MSTDAPLFRCTVCGRVGTVGRCCGLDTRIPLNAAARDELTAEAKRQARRATDQPKEHTK